MGDAPPPGLPPLGRLTVDQMLKSADRDLSRRVKDLVQKNKMKRIIGELDLRDEEERDQFFGMCNIDPADQESIKAICADELPFFIRTEIKDASTNLLRRFQKDFWKEIQGIWRNPTPEEENFTRLLMVAATGTGKSNLIALAPFAGARDRCLVLVPNLTILEGLRKTLGGTDEVEGGESVPPALKGLGLLGANDKMPRVLVLHESVLGKANKEGNYVYPPGSGTTARPLCEIILEHEIVLSTTQTLVAERGKKKRAKPSAAGADDHEQDNDIELTPTSKLLEMEEWIKENGKPLFDLLCFDEAHHIRAITWMAVMRHLGAQPSQPVPGLAVRPNTLLLTATPFHAEGNIDDPEVRDRSLTPYTLINGREDGITKSVVFMEIQKRTASNEEVAQTAMECNLEVLMLVGEMLKEKMRKQHHLPHRALIIIKNRALADALAEMYESLPENMKPEVRPGVKMVCAAYHGGGDAANKAKMQSILDNFQKKGAEEPVHCLIQCQKLGEGYDQPNISVAGICSGITRVSKFAQFAGRSVRKQDHNNVEKALVDHISNKKDNVAHIITHAIHHQVRHWTEFATQQGKGSFNPHGDDSDDDDDDNATISEDGTISRTTSEDSQSAQKKQKVMATRAVHRYALARNTEMQQTLLQDEEGLYDARLKEAAYGWTVENKTTGPGGAGPSNAA